ncbi:transketolase [candidate division WWE3 bacterium]|nr:transketolase [candidate division WWE3 bacterium]
MLYKTTRVKSNILEELQIIATNLRKSVIEMLVVAGSGHSAGPLDMAEVFATLYFHILNVDPKNPTDPDRDRLVLSAGHICPILYATLAHKGYISEKEIKTLRKLGSKLQGHPHNLSMPGIENSSGPLGQGLSQAIGMALAAKLDNKNYEVYCIGSDGELQEGQIWEAAMFAGNKRIRNLTWIIDRNNIQIDGYTEDVMPLEPLREKLEAFNWHVIEIDGHNIEEIISACNMSKAIVERPTAIIAHTIPGKGVDFMEYKFEWHGKSPSLEEGKKALHELRTLEGRIRGEHE